MPSTWARSEAVTRATLYDGATAFPHEVTVALADAELRLVTDQGHGQSVPLVVLTRDGEGRDWRFARSDQPGWRLRFDDEPPADMADRLPGPARYGRWIDRIGLGKAAVVCAAVAGAVLAIGYAAPAALAPHVPQSWERNLGTAIVGDFGDNRCRSVPGQRALQALAERVEPGTARGPFAISVAALDYDMVNAAALPGNNVIFFEGLLDEARSAEALAGVMAHEIAHVRRRHVTEALLRELGIGALVRLFSGSVGANAQQLVALRYTRSNEAEADADAIAALARAGIDPRPTAALFRRLGPARSDKVEARVEWLESHPGAGGRAEKFERSYDPRRSYRPALAEAEARRLLTMCRRP